MSAHPCYYRENLLPLPNICASIHLCPKPGCGQRLKVQQTKKGANYLAPQPQLFLRLAKTRSPLTPLRLASPLSTARRPPFNRAPSESIALATATCAVSTALIAEAARPTLSINILPSLLPRFWTT
ncbi:hypothetical protein DFH08DRAFT_1080028 [Mycena albidolilacea]|uniref:Uncharacterized protein n=1 Tax=Mycena albidolilacea TaxID=1033008 RepID=A0AAD7ERM4_9AGAR|nr:hypothetical protein DFH08DRAFT_1080028 [Mycena albidolilacea]